MKEFWLFDFQNSDMMPVDCIPLFIWLPTEVILFNVVAICIRNIKWNNTFIIR